MLESGQKFPEFRLANQDGKLKSNADFLGKWTVFYVYPKDDTPGCTIQGKAFTENKAAFEKAQASVVGISADDVQSHQDFCKKYALAVELLADPKAELLHAAGIGQSEYKGVKYWDRTTFLVDPKGTLRKVYPKVNPEGHEKTLLKDLSQLQKSV